MDEKKTITYLGGGPGGDVHATATQDFLKDTPTDVDANEADRLMADFPDFFTLSEEEKPKGKEEEEEEEEEGKGKGGKKSGPARKPR